MDYTEIKTAGVPLLTLAENGILTREFWLGLGAMYGEKPMFSGPTYQCGKCRVFLHGELYYWMEDNTRRDYWCKECRKESANRKYAEKRLAKQKERMKMTK